MIYAGEGGILVTDNEKIHDLVTALGHYRDRTKEEVKDPHIQQYWVTGFGQKYRMSPLNAVVAKHSLLGYPERKRQRHAALTYFSLRDGHGLRSLRLQLTQIWEPGMGSSPFLEATKYLTFRAVSCSKPSRQKGWKSLLLLLQFFHLSHSFPPVKFQSTQRRTIQGANQLKDSLSQWLRTSKPVNCRFQPSTTGPKTSTLLTNI
jgi:hypothetical protein